MASNILKDPTTKVLFSMTTPISLGLLSTFLFQVIDTYFVGKLGPEALAALSFSSTLYFLIVGIFIGLAVGVSILLGESVGSNNLKKGREILMVGLVLSFALSVLLSWAVIHWMNPIFSTLGASESLQPLIAEYMNPLLVGIPLLTIGMMAGANLRASGNIVAPDIIMGLAGVINLILDYLLIFGKLGFPEYGIKGAALATAISWVFVFLVMVVYMIKDKLIQKDSLNATRKFVSKTINVLKVSIPVITTQALQPLVLIFVTYLLAKSSENAVAAFGVASRIELLALIGITGVSMAITPFIAQNYGAKNRSRVEESIVFGGRSSVYLGILVVIILTYAAKQIAGIFTNDLQIINNTANYFYIVAPSYIFYGLFLVTSSIFNGLQLPLKSLNIMLVKTFAFTIPLTLVGSLFSVNGLFVGLSLSNILGGIYAGRIMRKDLKRVNSSLANMNILNEYKAHLAKIIHLFKK